MTTTHRSANGRAAAAALVFAATFSACASGGPGTTMPTPTGPRGFAAIVDSVVTTPPVDRTHWGIAVYDPATGRDLYDLNGDLHFVPASNTKLVVTSVAMGELGPDWRYRTPLYAILAPDADSVAETLVLVGRGDPTMSARFDSTDFAAADSLADSLAVAGLRVDGPLVVDASYFEDVWYNTEWNVGDRPWYYAAPVAGAGVAEGAVPYILTPGAVPGDAAGIYVLGPAGALTVIAHIGTDTIGARPDLEVDRAFDSDTVFITGTIPLDAEPDTSWLAVTDPARYLGLGLARALDARGNGIDGVRVITDSLEARQVLDVQPVPDCGAMACLPFTRCHIEPRRWPRPPEGVEPPMDTTCVTLDAPRSADVWPDDVQLPDGRRAVRIATWSSPPLAEIIAGILKPSQNWIAETLLKTLGARLEGEGSWEAGLRAEEYYLFGTVGIDSTAMYLRDGSGLTAHNLVTPNAVTRLLAYNLAQPWGAVYRDALAEPAHSGTLEHRLEDLDGRVHAKTGTIRHVNALSGYLTADDGRTLIFSVLTNGSGIGSSDVRDAIDRIVKAMTSIGSRP